MSATIFAILFLAAWLVCRLAMWLVDVYQDDLYRVQRKKPRHTGKPRPAFRRPTQAEMRRQQLDAARNHLLTCR